MRPEVIKEDKERAIVINEVEMVCQRYRENCFECPLAKFNCGHADCTEEVEAVCREALEDQ